jgi:hypothetical protein
MAQVGRAHAHSVIPSSCEASQGCQCILLRLGRLARRVSLLLIRIREYAGAAGATSRTSK